MTARPATNLPLTTSSRWIGWASSRGSVPSERSPLTASKANARPSSGATIPMKVNTLWPWSWSTVKVNRARKTAAAPLRLRGERPDLVGREIDRDRGRQPEDDQQHDEPDTQQVVAELLGRDHAPAGAGQRIAREPRTGVSTAAGSATAVSAAFTPPSS